MLIFLLKIDWAGVTVQVGQLLLALSILIVLHEFGHYITARWFGCRVEKFFLFFDPWFALVKKKVGDTVYGVGWLKWLFNLQPSQIQVVVHPQSIIHSMVQFEDGSMKAQMGLPDMKLPIQYGMAFPHRIPNQFPRLDFKKYSTLTFEEPDLRTFRNLGLAMEALEKGGNLPAIMNAANEIAVYAFLRNRVNFLDMTDVIEKTMQKIPFVAEPTLEEYFESDGAARSYAADIIKL